MAAPSSFNKRLKTKIRQIPGTKPSLYNNQLLVSTGIPSLDTVLRGGVAVGTVVLVEEDLHAAYAQLMVKYFCAEGIVNGHAVFVVSADKDPHQLIQELPAPIESGSSGDKKKKLLQVSGDAGDKMSIAWRYQNQPRVQISANSQFGHYYNLMKSMDEQQIKDADVEYVGFSDLLTHVNEDPSVTSSANCQYRYLLQKIRHLIEQGNYSTAVKSDQRNVLRIAIFGLGSSLWGDDSGRSAYGKDHNTSLLPFLLALKAVLRTAFSVCLLTVPRQVMQDPVLRERAKCLCDTMLKLESFTASEKEKNPALKDFTGLFHLIKLPCLNEIVPRMPETLDLAFRVRRKKFTIEKLHLPPELADTVKREQDDLVPVLHPPSGCSSRETGSSTLDF